MIGFIESYDPRKAWGYIQSTDRRMYFHISNCVEGFQPKLGVEVEYEVGAPFRIGKGPQALNVRPVEGEGNGGAV